MYHKNKQSGFTLVEIAIVLVIIGLLLGGILKGQELINSARVRNLADQNSGIQAAYYGFIDRYRQLPGDMAPLAACQAIGAANLGVAAGCAALPPGGNGNGTLDLITLANGYPEAAALWLHLQAAGFITGAFNGVAANDAAYAPGVVAPVNAFNGRVMLTNTVFFVPLLAIPRLAYVFGSQIPVEIMRELDVKIDDALPNTGVMRHSSVAGGATTFDSTATCVLAGAPPTWDINTAVGNCNALILY